MSTPRTVRRRPFAAGLVIGGAVFVIERSVTAAMGTPGAPAVSIALAIAAGLAVSAWGGQASDTLRSVVVLLTSVAVAAITVALVLGIPAELSEDERTGVHLGLLGAACGVAVALALRGRLQSAATWLIDGHRADPESVLEAWAGRMTRALPLDEIVLQLAEALTTALRASAVEIWTGTEGRLRLAAAIPEKTVTELVLRPDAVGSAARAGVVGRGWADVWAPDVVRDRDGDRLVRLAPVAHATTLLGLIIVEREGDHPFTASEDRLLTDTARRLGLALHNSALDTALGASLEALRRQADELEASRRRVVRAADDAARRIERNLHDGAQQHLVTLAVKLSLARTLLQTEPAAVEPILDELRVDVTSALEELRTLAQGIFPPVLVERGLREALLAAADRSALPVDIAVELSSRLPPEIEAATYFCCVEALQNAAKHAGPHARVRIGVTAPEGEVVFEVADDGVGFDAAAARRSGGLVQLADRVGAVAGTISVRSVPGAGTTVTGRIPLA